LATILEILGVAEGNDALDFVFDGLRKVFDGAVDERCALAEWGC